MVRADSDNGGSLGGKRPACAVHYIHVDNRDLRGLDIPATPSDSLIIGDIISEYPRSCNGDNTPTESSCSGSACSESCRTCSSERCLVRTSTSSSNSKRDSMISENAHPDQYSIIVTNTDLKTNSPNHSPSSGSLVSTENCDETGVLLYEQDKENHISKKSPKECWDQENFVERFRHHSKSENKLRIRHASYEGPASPKIKDREELVELGDFEKVVENCDSSSNSSDGDAKEDEGLCSTFISVCALVVLLFANLLNYMDRYTIAGVLPHVQEYYDITDSQAGLLQTSFILFYMLFSPLFGYLGDRYNRKWLMAVGIFLWSIITLAGSFVPSDYFWVFVLMRGMVGIGEASYSTIAPTIIADMFSKDSRTKALAVFYFAIPVGSGLGYIIGSSVAQLMGAWQWALRVTPPCGIVCAVLILLVVREPARGASDGAQHLETSMSFSGWCADIRYLGRNKSFMLSSLGFTCVAFVAGALAFWAPTYMVHSIAAQGQGSADVQSIALIFGVITCCAGLIGVLAGSETARRLRPYIKCVDPIVCAFGLIMCAPFLYVALVVAKYSTTATWTLIFIGETFLCLNWAIVTDILLYTVVPNRRSTAEAIQILMSHALGDAGSPYLVGVISDYIKNGDVTSVRVEFLSLQYALYCTAFVCVLGGGFFLATSLFVVKDRAKAERVTSGAAGINDNTIDYVGGGEPVLSAINGDLNATSVVA